MIIMQKLVFIWVLCAAVVGWLAGLLVGWFLCGVVVWFRLITWWASHLVGWLWVGRLLGIACWSCIVMVAGSFLERQRRRGSFVGEGCFYGPVLLVLGACQSCRAWLCKAPLWLTCIEDMVKVPLADLAGTSFIAVCLPYSIILPFLHLRHDARNTWLIANGDLWSQLVHWHSLQMLCEALRTYQAKESRTKQCWANKKMQGSFKQLVF